MHAALGFENKEQALNRWIGLCKHGVKQSEHRDVRAQSASWGEMSGAHCKVPREGGVGGIGDEVEIEPLQHERLCVEHHLFVLLQPLAELLRPNIRLLHL